MKRLYAIALGLACFLIGLQHGTVLSQQSPPTTPQVSVLEMDVLGFRVWMMIGFVVIGFAIIIVVLCCIFDCRIPRTKQQIDEDQERRDLIAKYRVKIKTMQFKKSKYSQARQRAAMMVGDWTIDGAIATIGTEDTPVNSEMPDAIPLAQHPVAMLTGSHETGSNPSNKPLGPMNSRPGNAGTARTLASLDGAATGELANVGV